MAEHQERNGLEETLDADERVFWRASPERDSFIPSNWVFQALGWAMFLLSVGFLFACVANIYKGKPLEAIIFFLMFVPWAVAAFYFGHGRIYIFSRIARNSQYILTDRRLIIRTHLLRTKYIIAQLAHINTVQTREMKSKTHESIGEVIIRVASPGLSMTSPKKLFRSDAQSHRPRGVSGQLVLFGVRNPEEIASLLKAAANAARRRPGGSLLTGSSRVRPYQPSA
jgi:hypothetical protein